MNLVVPVYPRVSQVFCSVFLDVLVRNPLSVLVQVFHGAEVATLSDAGMSKRGTVETIRLAVEGLKAQIEFAQSCGVQDLE